MTPEKLANSATQLPILSLTRRVGVVVAATILAMLMVWSIDHSTLSIVKTITHSPDFQHVNHVPNASLILTTMRNPGGGLVNPAQDGSEPLGSGPVGSGPVGSDQGASSSWVMAELQQNYSSNLLTRWLAPGNEKCSQDSKTVDINLINFDENSSNPVELSVGKAHDVVFQAVDESGKVCCFGGDYFEVDLCGESWRSRPVTKDFGNGTYSFTLQVHPDFAGVYNLTITLLFRHFEGLKFSTVRVGVDKQVRRLPVMFSVSETKLPELQVCTKSDFERDVWAGRWTRHGGNGTCEISNDGRYKCLDADYPCTSPWCNGSLGSLESNGWVYSAHCSFQLFSIDDAWNCMNNRWLFFWGDSNHVDTIRNLLFFFLGVPHQELEGVTRRFDKNFTNPKDDKQSVRITNIFNGHWNVTQNYQGLNSLSDEGYRELIKSFFNKSTVPDTVVFNSGLHDGIFWHSIRRFIGGAEYAASFWKDIMDSLKQKGLNVSKFIFRSTVATGGYARTMAFNPSKMEAFNGILLEKLKAAGLVTGVIDDFDMTWAWHFDNRCNDGVHYGRFPAKAKWRDGQIGHQYFVDLMLAQVLLNAICPR